MNRNRAKYLTPIIQAFSNGKIIEYKSSSSNGWSTMNGDEFVILNNNYDYRIKTEPKLVPFTFEDNKEFKDKWVKSKSGKALQRIVQVGLDSVLLVYGSNPFRYTYEELLEKYVFEDGSPCGKYTTE